MLGWRVCGYDVGCWLGYVVEDFVKVCIFHNQKMHFYLISIMTLKIVPDCSFISQSKHVFSFNVVRLP